MNRRNRSKFRVIISSPITLILALALLVLTGRAAMGIHAKALESAEKLTEAQMNLDRLQSNQANLEARIGELSTDAGREASIREKYHAIAPGEEVVVIVDDQPSSAAATSGAPVEHLSWWQRAFRAVGL